MVNKFAATGSGCACCAWLFVVLACGLPLFSAEYLTASVVSEAIGKDANITEGHALVGQGIWGTGIWLYGDLCEDAALMPTTLMPFISGDDSCYQCACIQQRELA